MHGNLWEWCEDDWHENYNEASSNRKAWLVQSNDKDVCKVLRGGSWNYNPIECRSANRSRVKPDARSNFVGFRVGIVF